MPISPEISAGDTIWAMSLRLAPASNHPRRPRPFYALPFIALGGLGHSGSHQTDARLSQSTTLIWPGTSLFVWSTHWQAQNQAAPTTTTDAVQNKQDTVTLTLNHRPPSRERDTAAFVFMQLKGGRDQRGVSPSTRNITPGQSFIPEASFQPGILTALKPRQVNLPVKHPSPAKGVAGEKSGLPSLIRTKLQKQPIALSIQPDTSLSSGYSEGNPPAFIPLDTRTITTGLASTTPRPVLGGLPFSSSFGQIQRDASANLLLRSTPAIFLPRGHVPDSRNSHSEPLSLSSSRPPIRSEAFQPQADESQRLVPQSVALIPPADLVYPSFERPVYETMAPLKPLRSFGTKDAHEKLSRPADETPAKSPEQLPGNVDRWQVIMKTIEQRISREVAIAVKQTNHPKRQENAGHLPPLPRPPVNLDDEGTASRLLQKIRRANRQERFRLGQLR